MSLRAALRDVPDNATDMFAGSQLSGVPPNLVDLHPKMVLSVCENTDFVRCEMVGETV